MPDRAATVEPKVSRVAFAGFPPSKSGFHPIPPSRSDWPNISKRRLICETI